MDNSAQSLKFKIMKTIITMIAASAALTAGALAAPAVTDVSGATTEVVAADEKTVTLKVTGLK